jgi:hypothetical protein
VHLNLQFTSAGTRDLFVTVHGFTCPADAIHIIVGVVVAAGSNTFAILVLYCKHAMIYSVLHCSTSLSEMGDNGA